MQLLLLTWAVTLLVAVLVSAFASRTVLSTSVLFLAAGLGLSLTGLTHLDPHAQRPLLSTVTEVTLFVVLLTDGMHTRWSELRRAWRLPGRALGWGLPLTLILCALAAHFVVGLDWIRSLLVGAILAPTDPVFASAIVGDDRLPARVRHLLNVESGLNDGLALPLVVIALRIAEGHELDLASLLGELGLGVAIGVIAPLLVLFALRTRFFRAEGIYEPLVVIATAFVIYALTKVLHGNVFLAAFSAGVTFSSRGQAEQEAHGNLSEVASELLKLFAVLLFGATFSVEFFTRTTWRTWLFAALAIVVARPLAIAVSFLRSPLPWSERAVVMWFGPRGFASVAYGLLVFTTELPGENSVFRLVALTVALSIFAHASTDVAVARAWSARSPAAPQNS